MSDGGYSNIPQESRIRSLPLHTGNPGNIALLGRYGTSETNHATLSKAEPFEDSAEEEEDESANSLGGMRPRKYLVTSTDLPPVSATMGSTCR